MNQTPEEATLQKAIQFYDKVKRTAEMRLSFAPLGDNGLPDASGAISSHSLSEMYAVCFERLQHVMSSLVEDGVLPDQVHDLSLQESTEARLAGTIFTAFCTFLIADLTELFRGGEMNTVSHTIDTMMPNVGQPGTLQNTALRKPTLSRNLPSTHIPGLRNLKSAAPDSNGRTGTKRKTKKKKSSSSTNSGTKSPTGKKSPSAKKKRKKSTKRSVRK